MALGTVHLAMGAQTPSARAAQAASEVELKLHVPADRFSEVERALHDRTRSHTVHLRAAYFDTPEGHLGAAGLAWRVRREGQQWVQTLKWSPRKGHGFQREEHNRPVPGPAGRRAAWPEGDATAFAGTAAGDRLHKVLGELAASGSPLPTTRFRTDVHRMERTQRLRTGGTVTFALDRGTITTPDGASTDLSELEIELVSGAPLTVITTARHWAERHGLWLDTVNKAMRGALLAQGTPPAPVARGARPALGRDMSVDAALRAMVEACLAPVLRNTSALANGLGGADHVHLARVNLRKLRTVLRELGPLSAAVEPAWADRLGEVFLRLGTTRDRDVIAALIPNLAAIGGPSFTLPPLECEDAGEVARDPAFTLLLLDLLAYAHGPALAADDGATTLPAAITGELRRLRRQALRDHAHFPTLPEEEQHLVRKRLKRLRYLAELTATLFPPKQAARYIKALAPAQDALGSLNDLIVARDTCAALAAEGVPEAWFAAGWAAAQIPAAASACVEPLAAAADAPRYWREVGSRRRRR